MSFLQAEWRKLLMVNYEINPELLLPYLPFGTKLDFWDGKCYVSIVGFMFLNTKLLGVKIPFHTNFEEVNLRFYVKKKENDEWKRGVVFIKEIVPKPALSFVANTVYNENYETLNMNHHWKQDEQKLNVEYAWEKANNWNKIAVTTENQMHDLETGGQAEFIMEHYWGYAKNNVVSTNEYEVKHPKWQGYKVLSHQIDIDFQTTYGNRFAFLSSQEPASVMLAEGSEISVEHKTTLKR